MFKVLSHQGHANQNDFEIPSYICQIKTQMTAHAGKDVEQGEHSFTAGGSANLYNHFGNKLDSFSENWEDFTTSPSYTTPGPTPKKCSIPQRQVSAVFITALFIITRTWKQP